MSFVLVSLLLVATFLALGMACNRTIVASSCDGARCAVCPHAAVCKESEEVSEDDFCALAQAV